MDHENIEPWDRRLAVLVGIGSGLIPLVAGLDELYNTAPPYGVAVNLLGLVLILTGYALATYAFLENQFFSGVVRIQSERGHHVISSGLYRWIRHPGYAGGLLSFLATPLLLDAPWAILSAALLTGALVWRAALEDHTLQEKLEGYRNYARQVRYRLLPGIW